MSAKKPEAVVLTDGGVLVKHTHDIEEAERLARKSLAEEYGLTPEEAEEQGLGRGRVIWTRITHCLPNSYGADEGWKWQYHYASGPTRGVFPAVEFLP